MTLLPIQVQLLTMWASARERVVAAALHARDDERGELTGGVILLVALALVAVTVGAIIAGKITSQAEKLP